MSLPLLRISLSAFLPFEALKESPLRHYSLLGYLFFGLMFTLLSLFYPYVRQYADPFIRPAEYVLDAEIYERRPGSPSYSGFVFYKGEIGAYTTPEGLHSVVLIGLYAILATGLFLASLGIDRLLGWVFKNPPLTLRNALILAVYLGMLATIVYQPSSVVQPLNHLLNTSRYGAYDELLIKAAHQGKIGYVKKMVLLGADVNARDRSGYRTALIEVADKGDLALAKYLVHAGADVNRKTKNGLTPLNMGIFSGNIEFAKFLVKQGALVNVSDKSGQAPLLAAKDKAEFVKFLVDKGAKVNVQAKDGGTPLMAAVNNLDLVRFLVERGAKINAKDNDGYTAVIKSGARAVTEYLVLQGAEINAETRDNYTALMAAKDIGTVRFLLERGADPNVNSKKHGTALILTIKKSGSFKMMEEKVKLLLKHGAKVDFPDADGNTALMVALDISAQRNRYREFKKTISLLMAEDIDVTLKNKKGQTALDIAEDHHLKEAMKMLLKRGAGKEKTIYDLKLVERGISVDLSSLMIYIERSDVKTVKLLLAAGVEPNQGYGKRTTPLLRAIGIKDVEMVKLLLSKGAHANFLSGDNRHPLMTAARSAVPVEIFMLLLESGAEVNYRDEYDSSVLSILLAKKMQKTDVAKANLLLDRSAVTEASPTMIKLIRESIPYSNDEFTKRARKKQNTGR